MMAKRFDRTIAIKCRVIRMFYRRHKVTKAPIEIYSICPDSFGAKFVQRLLDIHGLRIIGNAGDIDAEYIIYITALT